MVEFGFCPNCMNKLTEGSALVTKPSNIFKGDNVYILCKNCQQVLLYNKARDIIFDLDDYKEDKEIIAEINTLLSEIDNHYEVSEQKCSGDCSTCCGCALESEPEPSYKRSSRTKPAPKCEEVYEEIEEPVLEEQSNVKEVIASTLNSGLLAVNIKDPTVKLILVNTSDLDDLNLDEWVFFEMKPVEVKVKKVYDIVRS